MDPARALDLSPEIATALLARCAVVQAALVGRLVADLISDHRATAYAPDDDRLLTVEEAAGRLAQTGDWLYRHADELPFTVRVGRHVRFSSQGIDRYIRQRAGR